MDINKTTKLSYDIGIGISSTIDEVKGDITSLEESIQKELIELKENHKDIETNLDNIIESVNDLKISNKKVVDIALINYSLIRLILEQNDENLERMRKRTNTGLKIAGTCILLVTLILLAVICSMTYLHFQ